MEPFTTPTTGEKSHSILREEERRKFEGRLSPAAKEVVRRALQRSASRLSSRSPSPTISKKVVLDEWWLSKPLSGEGIAVGGSCRGRRSVNGDRSRFSGSLSASAKKLYARREFHSTEIVKYHDCNTVEDSAGFIIHLCGWLNEPRTLQNGFSDEVCRVFNSGFLLSWENYSSTQYYDDISRENSRENNLDHLMDTLESCRGAQLRDFMFSLTSTERAALTAKVHAQLIEKLEPPMDSEKVAGPSTLSFECRLQDVSADTSSMLKLSEDGNQATLQDTYCTPNVASMKKMDCATSGGDVHPSMKKDLVSSSGIRNKSLSRFSPLRTDENMKRLPDASVERSARVVAQEELPSEPTHEEDAVKLGKRKKPELAKTKRPHKSVKRCHKGMSSNEETDAASLDEYMYTSRQRAELVAKDKPLEGAMYAEGNVNDASGKKKYPEVVVGIAASGECNPTRSSNKSKGSETERNSRMKQKADEKGKPSIKKISIGSVNNKDVSSVELYHDRRVTRSMRSTTEVNGNLKPV